MTETTTRIDSDTEDFAQQIADAAEAFLVTLQAVSREKDGGSVISLLLLEVSQVLLAGARLGAQADIVPDQKYQPDVGPEPDLDGLRLRLANLLGPVDAYSYVFDPYDLEVETGVLSDDLTSIASDVANGLRHHRAGNIREALWWWQFSYQSSWGPLAGAVLRALQSVVAHDRFDVEPFTGEAEDLRAADEMLEGEAEVAG